MNKTAVIIVTTAILLGFAVSFVGTLCWFALYEFLRETCGLSFLGAVTAYSSGVSLLALLVALRKVRQD